MTAATATCDQAVIADGYGDGCCGPQGACGAAAAWLHRETGLALCAEHEANAKKYCLSGTWRVGDTEVSYPAGWLRANAEDDRSPGSPALEVVQFEG